MATIYHGDVPSEITNLLGEPSDYQKIYNTTRYAYYIHDAEIYIEIDGEVSIEDLFPMSVNYNGFNGEFESFRTLKYFIEHEIMIDEEEWK